MNYKEIHYDSVITEFGQKDDALYLHFRAGKKIKNIKQIDKILDKHIKDNFYLEVRPTGEFIQKQLEDINLNRQYSPKSDEKVNFPGGKSIYYKRNLPQERPEEFLEAQRLYRELMKLYDIETVAHKTWTEELNGSSWGEFEGWGYIIHYKSPFLDELMLKLCKEIDQELQTTL